MGTAPNANVPDGTVELFAVEEGDRLPAPAPKPRKRAVKKDETKTPAPVTSDGDNTKDIVGAWIDWFTAANNGVPIPNTIIARIGKQVKGLIVSGFTTNDIKYGLAIWTIRHVDTGCPPNQLDSLVWEWASKTRGNHRQWRAQALAAINEFSGGSVNPAGNERGASRAARQQSTTDTIAQWANK